MKISTYEICKTDTPEHINGTIVIIDEDGKYGYAVLMVKECPNGLQSSHEKIQKTGTEWKTIALHDQNVVLQDWRFEMNYKNHESESGFTNRRYDTKQYCQGYIKYNLRASDKPHNGSGTAGNTSGG